MLICNAAVGKSCLRDLSETVHSSGMANTLSSGLPGLYMVKSAKYSSAASNIPVCILVKMMCVSVHSFGMSNKDKSGV